MHNTWIILACAVTLGACGGGYDGTQPQRALTTVTVSALPAVEVGQFDTARVVALDQYGMPIATGPVSWSSSKPTVVGIGPASGILLALSPGTAQISATLDGKVAQRTVTVFTSPIRVNEIRANGNAPGGWVELFNPTEAPIELSGWTVTNGNVFQNFALPVGTTIPAFGFFVIDESSLSGGLGATDAVHVFSRFGVQVDGFAWVTDVATSFGRCTDGSGVFVTTTAPSKGTSNVCP